ncbi:MAG: hypothetical protein IPI38_17465 [Gemmatimonadetes bacterium]|nr:hypothetical protein [Gemmatimonadota bacterium]MBK7717169.1 hypothetical protein [Gemmatimonadota bacterium]MBK7922065.1 hypothetical protein [Gemmatimonadota bacterium]
MQGILLTQDPIGLAGGVNLYSYAGNNPIAFSDPFGLCPPEWLCRLAHFSAGFGDAVSFGLTDLVRDAIDANSAVDKGSGSYVGGFVAGMAVDAALGSAMAAEASASRASGVVYRRTNLKTGEQYIGRSKNEAAFEGRVGAHDRKFATKHKYDIIDRADGTQLRVAEESAIRRHGGPSKLANKRFEMNDEAYRAAGGTVPKP